MCKVGASCASIGSDEGRMVLNTYLIRKVNYLQVGQLIGPPPRPLAVLGGDQVLRLAQLTGQQAHLHEWKCVRMCGMGLTRQQVHLHRHMMCEKRVEGGGEPLLPSLPPVPPLSLSPPRTAPPSPLPWLPPAPQPSLPPSHCLSLTSALEAPSSPALPLSLSPRTAPHSPLPWLPPAPPRAPRAAARTARRSRRAASRGQLLLQRL